MSYLGPCLPYFRLPEAELSPAQNPAFVHFLSYVLLPDIYEYFIHWCQSSFGTSSFYFISLWKQINDLKAAVEASPPSGEVLPADRLKLIHQGKRHTQANTGKAVARDFCEVADGHYEGV